MLNPLQKNQIRRLKKLDCEDLARKIAEIIKFCNETKEQCFFGKEMTVNVCNGTCGSDKCMQCGAYLGEEHKKDCPVINLNKEEVSLRKWHDNLNKAIADGRLIANEDGTVTVNVCNGKESKKDLLKRMLKRSKTEGAKFVIEDELNKI